jgi:NAD(P)-dependent dehydrogenase (short-subunit alcohol dehydrogenase family)
MKHIVITGVSRGIGQKLTELSLERGDRVCGIARHPEDSKELTALKAKFQDHLVLIKGDVNDPELGKKITRDYPWKGVDVLINNAGIYLDDSWENFEKTFLTNSIAPYYLTLELSSLLKNSSTPKAAFITSQMGSIADNHSGGSVSYRASKAALNMMIKCLSVDERWLTSLLFHPGWVKTRMGGENAPTEKDESAAGLLELIHSSEKNHSGSFRNYKGDTLPW